MDKSLKEQYMQAMMRFRKICMILPQRSDLNMTELIVMKGIARNSSLSDNNTTVSEIQSKLHITKSAISQILTLCHANRTFRCAMSARVSRWASRT